ncbi:cyd operon YbgE family protein [Aeromonas veronii]|uniref:cyd operon YbgE family protein n=1 Tax=Aeromonas veronii TaxID=654 RepID=UPI001F1B2269|nr:cyd operon YbgE family protein [Aeromonas veronii]
MKTSDRLARLAAPLERQPWQGLMLLAAALLAVAILQAPNLIAANTSEYGLWLAPWLMWAVCCGVLNGLGFHLKSLPGRVLFNPWLAWPSLLYGLWLTHSYFLS